MLDVADFGPAPPYLCLRADEDLRSSVVLTGQRAQVSLGPVSGPVSPRAEEVTQGQGEVPVDQPAGKQRQYLGDLGRLAHVDGAG
jgi:hypothetical protein